MNLGDLKELPYFLRNPDPSLYFTLPYRVVDFETTNKDKGSARNEENRLVLGHMTWEGKSQPLNFDDGTALIHLNDALDRKILIAHNAKFELHWLRRLGYPLENILVYDTMMAEKVLAGNRLWPLDLDSLSAKYGGTQKDRLIATMMEKGVSPEEMPRGRLQAYCEWDCKNTENIFHKQLIELERLGLTEVVFTRCLLLPVLVDIECNGMQLDEKRVQLEYNRAKLEYDRLNDALAGHLNGANPDSPKQLAAFLYDTIGFEEVKRYDGRPERTPTGARKTDKPTLVRLRARTAKQKEVLQLITAQAALGTKLGNYLDKFRRACEEAGGRLYGDISQVIPRTHRLSSQGGHYKIQFHNMDRLLKPMIHARVEDWETGEGDQGQLEFRVAVFLTQDKQGKLDIANHEDVHTITRDYLASHGQVQTRQDVKPMTFRPVYGGTSGTPAEQAYCKFFNEKYPDMYATQSSWEMQVFRDRYLRTCTGLRFYWPDIRMRPNGKTTEHSAIFNYPVQYFATGEIVPIGLVYTWHLFKARKLKTFIINTVHDSVVWENPPSERKIIIECVNLGMVSCVIEYLKTVYGIDFNVPLEVETAFSPHWGDKDEQKKEANKHG